MATEERPTRTLARTQGFGAPGAPAPSNFGPGAMVPAQGQELALPIHNPAGSAALGGALGVLAGNVVAGLINFMVIMPRVRALAVPAVGEADTAEAAEQAAQEKSKEIVAEVAQLRRVAHTVGAGLGVVGAAIGAWVGADEVEKRGAAIGAAAGTAAVKAINIGFNPALGLPGFLAAAGGAYLGANRAVSRIA